MSPKISSTLTARFVIAVLAVSIGAPGVAAASSDSPGAVTAHRVRHADAMRHWHHGHSFARRAPPAYGHRNAPPGPFIGSGYVFVPGRGILDEACNLPTSTCPDTERDTQ